MNIDLRCGSSPDAMQSIESSSVDAIICDPPYPEISRSYGRMTESDWHIMMHGVVKECRRILKPSGSAVFILQPNSKKIGSMRAWLFEFQAWCCHEWNMLQDVWWWNICAPPESNAIQGKMMRGSVKACVWLGDPECYKNQDEILWTESDISKANRLSGRSNSKDRPSGHSIEDARTYGACVKRGGVTPFNIWPIGNSESRDHHGCNIHGARTPYTLCDRWVRYISPQYGTIVDPFMGSGTTGLAALNQCRSFIGIERDKDYFAIASKRIHEAHSNRAIFNTTW